MADTNDDYEFIKEEEGLTLTTFKNSSTDIGGCHEYQNLEEEFKKVDDHDDLEDYSDPLYITDDDYDESSYGAYEFSIPLSRKLKLIKHYYLPDFSQEHVQREDKFKWLKHRRGEIFQKESDNFDLDLRVKNEDELKYKIQELMEERLRGIEKAQANGKSSYFNWFFIDDWQLHSKIIQTAYSLCCHLCEFIFVVLKNSRHQRKLKLFKDILELLMENDKNTKIIKKVVSFIEKAETELVMTVKHNHFYDKDGDEDDMEEYFDNNFDIFLVEFMCLESMLSYPSLTNDYDTARDELANDQIVVTEFDNEVANIESEMCALKIQFLDENPRDEPMMEQFLITLKLWIASLWKNLEGEMH
ncbi:hypothetical protein CsatA_015961 [Cannabis sativa]